jgi:putative glutamine amidotransferase
MKSRRSAPLIGITPDVAATGDNAEPLIVLQERYARAIQQAGAIPLVLPIASATATLRRIIESLDGVVVSGGNFDIHPKYYGERASERLGNIREERTEFELGLISLALKRDMPLLGVCGGAQAINVALGGSLYQDIRSQVAAAADRVIEGIESQGHTFVLGVQWHPEFLVNRDNAQRKIFSAFVAACKSDRR